ncbi:MAG: glycosyltransferase, partial [Pseudohongiella sp.]
NPQKGIDEILHAAQHVKKRHPDVHFLIVGERLESRNGRIFQDADYHQRLQDLTDSLGINEFVWFTGHRADTASLLSQSTLSVLPSHSEGLSNSLIESMAAGLPLVATDVGGNPELVTDGINGLLVPVRNVAALATAINTILDDPEMAARFGAASRRMCMEQFSMEKMVTATQQIYQRELHRHTEPATRENAN